MADESNTIIEQVENNIPNEVNDFLSDKIMLRAITEDGPARGLYNLFLCYCKSRNIITDIKRDKEFFALIRKTNKFYETHPHNVLTFKYKN